MKSARFGITEQHWEILTRLLFQPIREVGGKVWVFGSRARGDYRKFSDLDLLIEGAVPSQLLASAGEALEESTLPFRVELVCESDLAETYRSTVLKEKVELR
jgi:predicted nucleotidyltransferase